MSSDTATTAIAGENRASATRVAFDGDWQQVDFFQPLYDRIRSADCLQDWVDIFRGTGDIPRHIKFGNGKLHKSVARFSFGSATDCPNRFTDSCQVDGDDCYAVSAEQGYSPETLDANRRREYLWDCLDAETFARAFHTLVTEHKHNHVGTLRFSVAGDVRYRGDAVKMNQIARYLADHGIDTYCYTASDHVDFRGLDALTVNASNPWVRGADRQYIAVADEAEIPDDGFQCPYDYSDTTCGECRACIRPEGDHDVYITEH